MAADPTAVVRRFIDAWNAMDFDSVLELLDEDVRYHTVSMAPLEGRAEVEAYIRALPVLDAIDWQVVNLVASGPLVMCERCDSFVLNGRQVTVAVSGAFEVEDGRITAWRDYFDVASFERQIEAARDQAE